MIPSTQEKKFLNRGSVGRVLCHASIEDCADLLLGIKHLIIPRTREEKFLHRASVERFQCLGSIKDCSIPLSGIKIHNDS